MSGASGGSGTPNLVPKPVSNFGVPTPKIGPRAICVPLDFSQDTAYSITLAGLINAGFIDGVQSVFVDNSENADAITISTQQGQNLIVPPGSQAYLPLLSSVPPDISFSTSGGVLVTVQLLNVPMPAAVWSTSGGGTAADVFVTGGSITVAGTVAINGGTVAVAGTIPVSGTVNILAADTVAVAGTVAINGGTVAVSGGTVAVAGTIPVSGTVNILAADTVAVAGTVAISDALTFSGSISAAGVITYSAPGPSSGIIDTTGYAAVSIQITNNGTSCTSFFQISNDGSTWAAALAVASVTGAPSTSGNSTGVYIVSKQARYFRNNVSTYGSGTFAVTVGLLLSNPALNIIAAQTSLQTVPIPNTSNTNGAISARVQSAASTNATSVKTSYGNLLSLDIGNNGTTDAWVKFYNKASAPTVGTDTPLWTGYVPKGTARMIPFDYPFWFSTGIAYAITGGAADTDTTAVAANQLSGILNYK